MAQTKTKTQITLSENLELIVKAIMQEFPIYDVNQSIEFLIAKGSKYYLDEMGMTIQDMIDIQASKAQIAAGKSTKTKDMKEAILKLKQ
jgi:hypothetical protein